MQMSRLGWLLSRPRIWLKVFRTFAVITVVGFASLFIFHKTTGIDVTVTNVGQTPMREVRLHVTGRLFDIGDLQPGMTTEYRVRPTSESHLEIEFTDDEGKRIRLNAGGYFEPGYRGTLKFSVRDGEIEQGEFQLKFTYAY